MEKKSSTKEYEDDNQLKLPFELDYLAPTGNSQFTGQGFVRRSLERDSDKSSS